MNTNITPERIKELEDQVENAFKLIKTVQEEHFKLSEYVKEVEGKIEGRYASKVWTKTRNNAPTLLVKDKGKSNE